MHHKIKSVKREQKRQQRGNDEFKQKEALNAKNRRMEQKIESSIRLDEQLKLTEQLTEQRDYLHTENYYNSQL
jgi:malate synthase